MERRQFLGSLTAIAGSTSASGTVAGQNEPMKGSFQYQRAFLDTEPGQLHYWTAGSGPNLVLVHQSANSANEYLGLIPLLSGQYRLIAVDLPGHGDSYDPKSEPSVEDYAGAVRGVLNHLKVDNTHLLGHHGGALTAMCLAAAEPNRFDRLILSGTGALRSPAENSDFLQQLLAVDVRVRAEQDFVADVWQRYLGMASAGADPENILRPFVEFLNARLRPHRAVTVYLKWDRRPAAKSLRGPVLLVKGERDEYVSGQSSLLTQIPNSTRVVLPGCGTFMFFDRPDDCAAMIREYLEA